MKTIKLFKPLGKFLFCNFETKNVTFGIKYLVITAFAFGSVLFPKLSTAQVWKDNAGAPSTISTKTDDKVGVGTSAPEGKTEVKYCDPQEPGVIVTKDNCNGAATYGNDPSTEGVNRNVIIGIYDANNPPPPVEVTISSAWANQPYFLTNNFVAGSSPTLQFSKHFPNGTSGFNAPLFWGREYGMNTFNNTQTSVTRFIVMQNGFTGINVATPRASLDVASGLDGIATAIFGTHARQNKFIPAGTTQSANYSQHLSIVARTKVATCNKITQEGDVAMFFTDGKGTAGANSSGSLVIAPWADNLNANSIGGLRIDQFGNLHAHGYIRTTEVKINPKWWPDFVFNQTYKLQSLDSVEQHIKIHSHLPNVPSEEEVIATGINVGEMQAIQLQKIEELTLYMIQLKKEIELLKKQNAEIKSAIVH